MVTKVCFTVDTECTIGGAFRDPALLPVGEQALWCMVAGRSEGLGFVLESLASHQLTATFFLETQHAHYFRRSPMRAAAHRIAADGHEVQLHTHPCWSVFQHADWRSRCSATARLDDFYGMEIATSVALIRDGQARFAEWGLPTPTVFRSGNLQHDDVLYQALAHCGIMTSSNIGMGIFDSGDARYRLYSGQHIRHGVLEMPVLSFSDRHAWQPGRLKSLTIAGTSFTETRALLLAAEQAGMHQVVVLTHPSEFVRKDNDQFSVTRRHQVNQRRLQRLCQFLAENRERFPCVGMAQAAQAAPSPALCATPHNTLLQTRPMHSLLRQATNLLYDRLGSAALGW